MPQSAFGGGSCQQSEGEKREVAVKQARTRQAAENSYFGGDFTQPSPESVEEIPFKGAACREQNALRSSHRRYWVAKLERNAERDKRVRRALRREGWRVLTVWECQTRPDKVARLEARIAEFLGGRDV
jgi:hypothetical protein